MDFTIDNLSPDAATSLSKLPGLLRAPELRVEDLLGTRVSSMLYFIVKVMRKSVEYGKLAEHIFGELEKLKEVLVGKWEATDRLDVAYHNMKVERANTTWDDF